MEIQIFISQVIVWGQVQHLFRAGGLALTCSLFSFSNQNAPLHTAHSVWGTGDRGNSLLSFMIVIKEALWSFVLFLKFVENNLCLAVYIGVFKGEVVAKAFNSAFMLTPEFII